MTISRQTKHRWLGIRWWLERLLSAGENCNLASYQTAWEWENQNTRTQAQRTKKEKKKKSTSKTSQYTKWTCINSLPDRMFASFRKIRKTGLASFFNVVDGHGCICHRNPRCVGIHSDRVDYASDGDVSYAMIHVENPSDFDDVL